MDLLRGVEQVLLGSGYWPPGINVQCPLFGIVVGVSRDGANVRRFFIAVRLACLESDLIGTCNQMVDNGLP